MNDSLKIEHKFANCGGSASLDPACLAAPRARVRVTIGGNCPNVHLVLLLVCRCLGIICLAFWDAFQTGHSTEVRFGRSTPA